MALASTGLTSREAEPDLAAKIQNSPSTKSRSATVLVESLVMNL